MRTKELFRVRHWNKEKKPDVLFLFLGDETKKIVCLSAFDGSETIGLDSFTTGEMTCLALLFFFLFSQ